MINEEHNNVVASPSEVHDVTVVTTDGRRATADVVYSRAGDLITTRVEFTMAYPSELFVDVPGDFPQHLVQEVVEECREACMYQRDLLKSKN